MLSYGFMQRAFLAGLLAGAICSLLSFFVVMRRLSFAGAGIAHAAFGGLAIGLATGLPPLWSALVFSLAVALLIGLVRSRRQHAEDTNIGIFFAASMALGVLVLSRQEVYHADVFGYLFGNILTITRADLALIGAAGAVILLTLALFFREMLFLSFDEEAARAAGLPTRALELLLLALLALAIVVTIRVTGVILVSALLVIPAAAAGQLSDNYRFVLGGALACGIFSNLAGLVIAYRVDLPPGATIVMLATAIFFATRFRGHQRFARQRPPRQQPPQR